MIETKLEIGQVTFECTKWETTSWDRVSINYIEHSSYCLFSDIETSIDLSLDQARQIIAFLQDAYPELKPK